MCEVRKGQSEIIIRKKLFSIFTYTYAERNREEQMATQPLAYWKLNFVLLHPNTIYIFNKYIDVISMDLYVLYIHIYIWCASVCERARLENCLCVCDCVFAIM